MPGRDTDRSVYSFAGFTLDVARGMLSHDGNECRLRPKSYAVLRYLVENPGRLVGKQELLDAVWGSTIVTEGSLTQCVIDIRRALGDSGQRLLRTVPRQGFLFDTAVSTVSMQLPPSPDIGSPVAEPASEPTVDVATTPPSGRSRTVVALLAGLLLVSGVTGWFIAHRDTDDSARVGGAHDATRSGNSIAVLRFLDLSPGGDQAYFADGLAEEILHLLAQSPDLRAIARSSSFVFDPRSADIATVADQLDVAYVLEGSVRRAGDQLRITVQLVDTTTRAHVWSRTYDREFGRLLELQRVVAVDVADRLKASLAPSIMGDAPGSAAAQDLYLLARHLFHRRKPGDLEAAERHLEQAVAINPSHARAWTALAGTLQVRGIEEFGDPAYRLETQREALERALELDPGLAEAHVRLSRYFRSVNDPGSARAHFERARQLGPRDPLVLAVQYREALLEGRLAEALELYRHIVRADPLSPMHRLNLGTTLLGAGLYEEGLEQYRRARSLSGGGQSREISRALALLGRHEEARAELGSVPEGPHRDQLQVLLGPEPDATAALRRLQADDSVLARALLAEIAAFRGDADAAFEQLERAAERAARSGALDAIDYDLVDLWTSPFLAPLRDDGRWAAIAMESPKGS